MRKLRLQWGLYLFGSLLVFLVIGGLLFLAGGESYAGSWLLRATPLLLVVSVYLWYVLPRNMRKGEDELLPRFGKGNYLTAFRGTLIAALSGFFFLPRPSAWAAWLPALLYLIATAMDFMDGFFARRGNMVTRMGEALDINFDAMGVLVVTALAFHYGTVPWWYVPFGFARYLFLLGIYIHRGRGTVIQPLRPSNMRRWFAGIQMGFLAAILFPILPPVGTRFAATLFMIPFWGMFVIDFLQVTGSIGAVRVPVQIQLLLNDWLPLLMRVCGALLYGAFALDALLNKGVPLDQNGASTAVLAEIGEIYMILNLLFAVGLVTGAGGRLVPIAALLALGIRLNWTAFTFVDRFMVFGLIYLLFVGMGRFSLADPIAWLIENRLGGRGAA